LNDESTGVQEQMILSGVNSLFLREISRLHRDIEKLNVKYKKKMLLKKHEPSMRISNLKLNSRNWNMNQLRLKEEWRMYAKHYRPF
jgi:hypothetical protein